MSTITIFHTEKIRDIILKESTTYYYIFLYFWVKWSQFLELTVLILRGKEVPLSCQPNGKWSLHISLVVFKAILFTFVRALPVFDDTFSCSFRRLKSIKLIKKQDNIKTSNESVPLNWIYYKLSQQFVFNLEVKVRRTLVCIEKRRTARNY